MGGEKKRKEKYNFRNFLLSKKKKKSIKIVHLKDKLKGSWNRLKLR